MIRNRSNSWLLLGMLGSFKKGLIELGLVQDVYNAGGSKKHGPRDAHDALTFLQRARTRHAHDAWPPPGYGQRLQFVTCFNVTASSPRTQSNIPSFAGLGYPSRSAHFASCLKFCCQVPLGDQSHADQMQEVCPTNTEAANGIREANKFLSLMCWSRWRGGVLSGLSLKWSLHQHSRPLLNLQMCNWFCPSLGTCILGPK